MFGTVDEFFSEYLRYHTIENFVILITGREIISDHKDRYGLRGVYKSIYKDVIFAPKIAPNPAVEESFWGSSNTSQFGELYKSQLSTKEVFIDVCAIVDLVVNKDKNVILLCSNREGKMEFFEYLREFIMENFKLYMVSTKEVILDPELLTNYGNKEEIKNMLLFQIQYRNIADKTFGEFINTYVDDAAERFKEILMKKSIDELAEIGKTYQIHINKYKPKDLIVERILTKLMES